VGLLRRPLTLEALTEAEDLLANRAWALQSRDGTVGRLAQKKEGALTGGGGDNLNISGGGTWGKAVDEKGHEGRRVFMVGGMRKGNRPVQSPKQPCSAGVGARAYYWKSCGSRIPLEGETRRKSK